MGTAGIVSLTAECHICHIEKNVTNSSRISLQENYMFHNLN